MAKTCPKCGGFVHTEQNGRFGGLVATCNPCGWFVSKDENEIWGGAMVGGGKVGE